MAPWLVLLLVLPFLHAERPTEEDRFRHCGCFPQLENSPSSVYALEGDDVTIYAGRTAVDPTRIQWEVDSTHSTIKLTGVRMSSKTLPDRMILKNVTASFNLSRYRYTLPSGFNSAWVTLRIGTAPDVSSNDLQEVTVVEGEAIPVICLSMSGLPAPDLYVQLRTPEGTVPLSYVLVEEGGLCVRTNSTVVSSGSIVVTAENCFGNASMEIMLSVQVKPFVTLNVEGRERLVMGEIHQDIILTYQVGGVPSPRIIWYLEGATLTESRSQYNSSHLLITDLKEQDSGLYKVLVINKVGSDNANFTLEVIPVEDSEDDTTEKIPWWYFVIIAVISAIIGSGITVVVCTLRRRKCARYMAAIDSSTYSTTRQEEVRYASMNLTRSGTMMSEQGGVIRPYATTHVSMVMAADTQELYEEPITTPLRSISENTSTCPDLTSQGYEPMSPPNEREMTFSTRSRSTCQDLTSQGYEPMSPPSERAMTFSTTSRSTCPDLTSQGYEPMSPLNEQEMTFSTGSSDDAKRL